MSRSRPRPAQRACQERNAAGAASACTPITSIVRPDRLRDDARARSAAAAADRHHDRVHVWTVFDDLERLGADPCDQERLVARVDVTVAVLGGQRRAVLASLVEVLTVLDQLRALRAHRGQLDRVGAFRDAHAGRDAEEARGVGDRLPVVASRGGDQSAPPLVLPELRDEVDAAADLEGAHRLMVLVLHPDLGPEQLVESGIGIERRRPQMRGDAAASPPGRRQA